MMVAEEGEMAPDFDLSDGLGERVSLSAMRGNTVVLYFYPKDDTSGCTKEACAFRDDHNAFLRANAVVLGVSPDDADSHEKFRDKYSLPFPLLSDPDHKVAEAYGAWGTKVLYGRESVGIIRSTFVIGPDGKIVKAWRRVRLDGHTEAVLASLP